MKKIIYTLILLFILIPSVKAEEKTGFVRCINDNSPLNVRDNVSGNIIKTLTCNTSITIVEDNAGSDDNCPNWYQIRYDNDKIGYACGTYINFDYTNDDVTYELEEDYGYVSCVENNDPLNIRSSITSYDTVALASCDSKLEILDKEVGSNYRCNNWYQVKYNDKVGYACGTYIYQKTVANIDDNAINAYRNYLHDIGFPDSYIDDLVELHKKHPNWIFRPLDTRLDFNTVVDNESVAGRNLVYYTYGEDYRSKESYSYDYETDTYFRHPTEVNWWYASREAISYYLDPRNFLNENGIFAFETLSYQSSFQTTPLVRSLLDKTLMPSIYSNFYEEEDKLKYAQDFIEAAVTYNISPVHLATRIIQEGNSSSSVTYDGVEYPAFNFFNIRATGVNPAYQGLLWAASLGYHSGGTSYGRPWDTPKKSIMGGAEFLSSDYIGIGQDTLYFQKFAVSVEQGRYTHQYQQNLTAQISEGINSYKTYNSNNLLDKNLIFVIPLYDNMPSSKASIPQGSNPNSYLKYIKLNNEVINNFKFNNFNYEIEVDSDTKEVSLEVSPISNRASVEKEKVVTLEKEETLVEVLVTAENGNTSIYNLKIKRPLQQLELSSVNDLKTLTIDKISFDFDKDILEYNLETSYETDIINITYEKEDNNSNVELTSQVNLIVGKNTININVTAQDGNQKTYVLNIIRNEANLDYILNSSGIKYNDKYLKGINLNTSIDSLKENILKINSNTIIEITNNDGSKKEDNILVTGDKITLKVKGEEKTLEVLIYGDVNGDSKIDKLDALAVLRQYYNYASYEGVYKEASDVNHDNVVDKLDVLAIIRDYYGYASIIQ